MVKVCISIKSMYGISLIGVKEIIIVFCFILKAISDKKKITKIIKLPYKSA